MRYEIINPSDACWIEAESDAVAAFITVLASAGAYVARRDGWSSKLYLAGFGGDPETDFCEEFGAESFLNFMRQNKDSIIRACESATVPGERTSLNDVASRFHKLPARLNWEDEEEEAPQ